MSNIYKGITVSPAQASRLLKKAVDANISAMMWGKYGIGKTSVVYQLAEENKDKFDSCIVINPSQDDVIDLKLPYVDVINGGENQENVSRFAMSDRLPRKGRHIIFVDEINTAQTAIQATLYSLILEGRIGSYKLPPGCVRFAAGNRIEDGCAAMPMSAALKDRLGIHMNVVPDEASWIRWATTRNIAPEVIAFVRNFPSALEGHNVDDPSGGCTPRSLEALSNMVKVGIDESEQHIVANGIIGQGAGAEFVGFLDIFRSKIDIDDILKNPKTAPIFKELDIVYSVVTGIASKMNTENLDDAMDYLERLDRRYMVMAMSDAFFRNRDIAGHKRFSKYILENFKYFT